jgi:hypothetical protein
MVDDEAQKPDEAENNDETEDIDNEESDFSQTDNDVEIPDENECPECLIPKEKTCSKLSDVCSETTVDTVLYASFRKDFYYPNYQEGDVTNPIPAPVKRGKVQYDRNCGKGWKGYCGLY